MYKVSFREDGVPFLYCWGEISPKKNLKNINKSKQVPGGKLSCIAGMKFDFPM